MRPQKRAHFLLKTIFSYKMNRFRPTNGFTLIELAIVITVAGILILVANRALSTKTIGAAARADQLYQTSAVFARNWQQLTQSAGASNSQGGAYWTVSNPLLACAASTCATSGDNYADGQRSIRVLVEGTSAMNPTYSVAWTNAGLTALSTLVPKSASTRYQLNGFDFFIWGNGSNGPSTTWAMGPFVVYFCSVSDDIASALAWKYYGLTIDSTSNIETGAFQIHPSNSCGTGFREVALVFQI